MPGMSRRGFVKRVSREGLSVRLWSIGGLSDAEGRVNRLNTSLTNRQSEKVREERGIWTGYFLDASRLVKAWLFGG